MKVLIAAIPGYGHICPLIPLAQVLRDSGHKVAFATSTGFAGELEQAGIALLPAGPHWRESDFPHERCPDNAAHGMGLRDFLATQVEPAMVRDLITHAKMWRPDLILGNDYERVGCAIAERYHTPFVLASSGPRLPLETRRQWFAGLFDGARRLLDMPPDPQLDYASKWLHLHFSPSHYVFEGGAKYVEADNEFGIRPEIFDAFASAPSLPSFDEIDERPRVLCTFGTVFNKNEALLRSIIEAFRGAPYRLFVIGARIIADELPENVAWLEYAPLSTVAPRVDACITHGGTSTVASLLKCGKPLLFLPQGADQAMNAFAARAQGLGIVRLEGPSESSTPTPTMIRAAIDELLQNPCYKNNCAEFGRELDRLPPLARAVELMEILADTRQPVVKSGLSVPARVE